MVLVEAPNSRAISVASLESSVWLMVARMLRSINFLMTMLALTSSFSESSLTVIPSVTVISRLTGGALPNARILIHQPHGGAEGQASDIEIQAREMLRTKQRLNEILALHTGQPVEKISRDTDRDNIFEPDAAKEYGLIDLVIRRREETKVAA